MTVSGSTDGAMKHPPDDHDGDESEEEVDTDYMAVARKSLFAAVEGVYDDHDDHDEKDGEDEIPMHSHRPFVKLFKPSNSNLSIKPGATAKELKQLILNAIKGFHKKFARRFFAGLKQMLEQAIEAEEYVPESAYQDEEDDRSIRPEDITPDARSSLALEFLLYSIWCVQAHLDQAVEHRQQSARKPVSASTQQQIEIITEVLDVAMILSDVLFNLRSFGGPDAIPVQTALVNLCESWWHANAVHRDHIVAAALQVLVLKALGSDGKPTQTDIKRLMKIQDAFRDIEFSDESSQDLRSFLLKLVASPMCLQMKEGVRFLASLFLLEPSLTADLHRAIRMQISDSKKGILRSYGDIYKRAWKDSLDHNKHLPEIQEAIEESALQDLMYTILHVANPQMHKALLVVLEPFHESKKQPEIESLLHRMYGPILWRALTAANAQVRINAAAVLAEAFPLQEPSHSQTDAALRKCIDAMNDLMRDHHPKVRTEGSQTVAKVLSTFWNALSPRDIKSLLDVIVIKHSSDTSSPDVRAGALKAIEHLLGAPEALGVLRPLLPRLGNLIHDKIQKVRLAAVNLLEKVKSTPGIKYYKVVPHEHLIARLAEEGRCRTRTSNGANGGPVAAALTKLMVNSFVPRGPNVTGVKQIERTIILVQTDPEAAAVFYANLPLPIASIAKLAVMLLHCVHNAVVFEAKKRKQKMRTQARKRRLSESHEHDEVEAPEGDYDEAGEAILDATDTTLVAYLVETICILLDSIIQEFDYEVNEKIKQFLLDSFSGNGLLDILKYFERQALECEEQKARSNDEEDVLVQPQEECYRVCAAVLRCAGHLEASSVEGLASHISSSLKKTSFTSGGHTLYKGHICAHFVLLCRWEMTEDVAHSLSSAIVSRFEDVEVDEVTLLSPDESSRSKKRKSVRRGDRRQSSATAIAPPIPPEVALDVLGSILKANDPNCEAARDVLFADIAARDTIEDALHRGTVYAGRLFRGPSHHLHLINESNFEFIMLVCETLGRFSLHKAAYSQDDTSKVEFNAEAKHILEWTTEQVVPSFSTDINGNPLQDLDLSRISFVNDSMVSLEPVRALVGDHEAPTPRLTPLGPPRKKGNLNATPERLEDTFLPSKGRRKDSKIISGESPAMIVRSAACSMLQFSSILFSEWLAVTGGVGSEQIEQAAIKWCAIFELDARNGGDKENNISEECCGALKMALLPAFSRLAVLLVTTSNKYQLFNKVLSVAGKVAGQMYAEEEVRGVLDRMVSTLLTNTAVVNEIVGAILDISYDATKSNVDAPADAVENSQSNDKSMELPTSMDDVVICCDEAISWAVSTLLSAVSRKKSASLQLAKKLTENLTQQKLNHEFEAKCLWILCDSGACRDMAAFKGFLKKAAEFDRDNAEYCPANCLVRKIFQRVREDFSISAS